MNKEEVNEKLKGSLSLCAIPDKTNRLYIPTRENPEGELISGEEVDEYLKKITIENYQSGLSDGYQRGFSDGKEQDEHNS